MEAAVIRASLPAAAPAPSREAAGAPTMEAKPMEAAIAHASAPALFEAGGSAAPIAPRPAGAAGPSVGGLSIAAEAPSSGKDL